MNGLTMKQKAVLDYVKEHRDEHGISPTVREIGRRIRVNSSCTVQRHIDALVKKGYLQRTGVYDYRNLRVPGEVAATRGQMERTLRLVHQLCGSVSSDEWPHILKVEIPALIEGTLPELRAKQPCILCDRMRCGCAREEVTA